MNYTDEQVQTMNTEREDYEATRQRITEKLRTYVMAAPPPKFAIPISLELIQCMGADLGAGHYILIDSHCYQRLIQLEHSSSLDPVARHASLLCGHLATLKGAEIYTDAYMHSDEKILPRGGLYVMSVDGSTGYAARIA